MTRRPWICAILVAAACHGGERAQTSHFLDEKLAWYGDNRARLEQFLDEHARHRRQPPPVAVLDWDNTMAKNDVGDAMVYYLLRHDGIVMPPNQEWKRWSRFLTDDAATALDDACGDLAAPGDPLPTSISTTCAREILTIYGDGRTWAGSRAFAGFDRRRMQPQYYFGAALGAGRRPDELAHLADAAIAEALAAPVGATRTIGTVEKLPAYLRIYDQSRDLLRGLRAAGFDVWIVSASPQEVLEPFAARVGVARDHVVGTRLLVGQDGKLDYHLAGCGDVADGADQVIPYVDGKRCWINRAIFGDTGAGAFARNPDRRRRPTFAAGDADTDVTFLQDATGLKFVINRNKPELMCNAYNNKGGRWLVNPMFIAPLPQLVAGYPCSTTACTDKDGKPKPCLDEDGDPIPDQRDTVY